MNALSPSGQKGGQRRGQLCFGRTGEIEAAAPAARRKAEYYFAV